MILSAERVERICRHGDDDNDDNDDNDDKVGRIARPDQTTDRARGPDSQSSRDLRLWSRSEVWTERMKNALLGPRLGFFCAGLGSDRLSRRPRHDPFPSLPFPSLPFSTMPADPSLGGLCTFNIHHGFTEAVIRGFRSGFLDDESYHHLTQCDNLEASLLHSI